MSNLNQFVGQGNLVADPKSFGDEGNVVRFTVAINNGFGERKTTTFLDCVAFGKQAPTIAKHFEKGKPITVRGSLIPNEWEDKETGQRRVKLELQLATFDGFYFGMGGRPENAEASGEAASEPVEASAGEDGKLF